MAVAAVAPYVRPEARSQNPVLDLALVWQRILYFALLSAAALVVHGYHPYAEDAAIYLPAIKKQLDHTLYPQGAEFFLAHAHFSVLSNLVALSVRVTHLPLTYALLLWYVASIALTLIACWRACRLCFGTIRAATIGTLLMTSVLTLPVAGTSLLITDPYLTGRSMSTPLLLFAVGAALERRTFRATALCLVAAMFHPLMALYGGVFVATLLALEWRRKGLLLPLAASISGLAIFGIFHAHHHVVSASYREAALTRSYLFLSNWTWYELLGLVGPMVLLAWLMYTNRRRAGSALWNCALAALLNGMFFVMVALFTVRNTDLVELGRYQPLRALHLVYVLLFLLPVNAGVQWLVGRRTILIATILVPASIALFAAERQSFPASPHIEWPGMRSVNPWRQAFNWVRQNTPKDAVFALAPDYMDEPAEDHLGFRAYAERTSLADRSKDGGVATLFPQLASEWLAQANETAGVNRANETEAMALHEQGVSWIVRREPVGDSLPDCPYRQTGIEVCRLSELPPAAVTINGGKSVSPLPSAPGAD